PPSPATTDTNPQTSTRARPRSNLRQRLALAATIEEPRSCCKEAQPGRRPQSLGHRLKRAGTLAVEATPLAAQEFRTPRKTQKYWRGSLPAHAPRRISRRTGTCFAPPLRRWETRCKRRH